jgi:hypothetical protein
LLLLFKKNRLILLDLLSLCLVKECNERKDDKDTDIIFVLLTSGLRHCCHGNKVIFKFFIFIKLLYHTSKVVERLLHLTIQQFISEICTVGMTTGTKNGNLFWGRLYERWISYPLDKSYPMDTCSIQWMAICRIKMRCTKRG